MALQIITVPITLKVRTGVAAGAGESFEHYTFAVGSAQLVASQRYTASTVQTLNRVKETEAGWGWGLA